MPMKRELLQNAEPFFNKQKRKNKWYRLISVLGCVVVFCVTYALMLPAITQEEETFCGKQEHSHTEDCYTKAVSETIEKILICTLEEAEPHIHGETCYELQGGHAHVPECYAIQQGELICQLEESEEHSHEEACYEQLQVLNCGLEEAPGEQVLICTLAETEGHAHAEACYAEKQDELTCLLPENESHTHGDRCYGNWTVTCGQQEHIHDLSCRADKAADLESVGDWEQSFAHVELTGKWNEDVLAIAETQMDYAESERNYIVPEGTTLTKGYTRYGAWYGDWYGDWCAMFASFCLHYAGVDMPLDSYCPNWILSLDALGLYHAEAAYTPAAGDLIFFDWDGDLDSDHVGLVKEFNTETNELTTIEGNKSNRVASFTYAAEDEQIMGYGALPVNPANTTYALAEQVLTATIYTDSTYAEPAKDDTLITVSGMLPVGAEARAYSVTLENETIDGKTVVLAYDISVFDSEGQLFEQADSVLNVSIRPADWSEATDEAAEEETKYDIYYIPEEGEPEPMDTISEEGAVSFQTDHFSVYAVTATGTKATVYLNGTTGNDSNSGDSANAAVKTLNKAMELVKEGGTIYISGTVTVSEPLSLSSKVTIKRGTSFTGPLITVANGGELTLSNVTINGGSGTPSDSNIATNSTYANNSAKAPLIVVEDEGRLIINDGTKMEYNSNKPNSSNNKVQYNGYVGLGGAVYCQGTLTMNGGLIQYCEAQCGGGIYVENGEFYLNGGTIDHNYARDIVSYKNRYDNFHKNAGGGVYVGDNAIMTMTGGVVSNNQSSREGGGISLGWLNRTAGNGIDNYITTFTMNGGLIKGNYAVSTGGGLNITAGRQAFINVGRIEDNQADGKEYQDLYYWTITKGQNYYTGVYTGGGIYVDASQWSKYEYKNNKFSEVHDGVPGKAVINRVIITDNSGYGIAACATSINFVYDDVKNNGTAIYGNTSSEIYAETSEVNIGDKVLGGGNYNWSKGSGTWENKLTDTSPAIQTATQLATVFITGNTGSLGAGIGCNGLIEIGGEKEESTYINIQKVWQDDGLVEHPEYIDVQILQDGKLYRTIRIYRSTDENGNEVWPTFYVGGLPSKHTYTIQEIEVPGYIATIESDGQDFIITNMPIGHRVEKKWIDESGEEISDGLPESIQVQLCQNGAAYGDLVDLTAENGWTYFWKDLPEKDENGNVYEYTVKEQPIPDGFYNTNNGFGVEDGKGFTHTITNIKSDVTTISVEKKWLNADGTSVENPSASVNVQLYQNGNPYRKAITLSAENDWLYEWDDLPVKTVVGSDASYTVKEIPVDGYTSYVEETTRNGPNVTVNQWEAVTSLDSSKYYYFVAESSGRKLALTVNGSNGVTLTDVTSQFDSGSNVTTSVAKWKYTGSKLISNGNKYLRYSNQKFSTTDQSSGSGTNITFSNQRISYSSSWNTYYLTNGDSNADSSSSKALLFTAYEYVAKTIPGESNVHFIITNTAKPAELTVNFAKYSDGVDTNGNPTLLAGADLELYKMDEKGDKDIPGTGNKGILIGAWTSVAGSNENPNGIHMANLLSGTYYLVETKAPDGHSGLTGPIIFEVNAEAKTVTITDYPDRDTLEGTVNGSTIPVYNMAMVVLPETGGPGTHMHTIGGFLLMLSAGFLLMYRHYNRGKEE